MLPLFITGIASAMAAGLGLEQTFQALRERRSGLRRNDFKPFPHATWIERVDGIEARPVAGPLADFACRNNRRVPITVLQDRFLRGVGRAAIALGTMTGGDA